MYSFQLMSMMSGSSVAYWAIVTGAGTGIGAALTHTLCKKGINVLAVGRRMNKLETMKEKCPVEFAKSIRVLSADIASVDGRKSIFESIPHEENNGEGSIQRNFILFLIQNAAIGEPGRLLDIDAQHFSYAMEVNVTAPLALTQGFIQRMMETHEFMRTLEPSARMFPHGPRILHLGTSVAFQPQLGTATYGVTKMAFHRLYLQLKEELKVDFSGVCIGSASPGVVDTEGLHEHIELATNAGLPHVAYFDQVKANNWMIAANDSAEQLTRLLLTTSSEEFSGAEWTQKELRGVGLQD